MRVLWFNRRRGYRYREVVADGGFHAVDPLVNTALAMSWASLGRLGHPDGARRAAAITAAMVDRLHDPASGLFYPEGPDGRPLRVSTWASLAPLALDDLPAETGRRLVEEHLLDPSRYWLPYPVPSTAADEGEFRAGRIGRVLPRYWRGPTWLFSLLPLLVGLQRAGPRRRGTRPGRAQRAPRAPVGLPRVLQPVHRRRARRGRLRHQHRRGQRARARRRLSAAALRRRGPAPPGSRDGRCGGSRSGR